MSHGAWLACAKEIWCPFGILPKKKWNCAFGNAKKHGLIFQFSLFNRFFSLELRTPFSKSMFWQKSQNLTMLPNGPKLEGRNVLRRYSIGLMLDI